MASETKRSPTVFSEEELASFRKRGYVRLKDAFPRELALELQQEIWDEIGADHGILRDDRSTWKPLPKSPRRSKHSATNAGLTDTRFTAAISDLLGNDDWKRPATWGGFNIFFPEPPGTPWDVATDTWHWDGPPTDDGLLIFSFYGDVRPQGGGTQIGEGSPRLIQAFYDSLSEEERARPHKFHRKRFARWDPWLESLWGLSKNPVEDRVATFMHRETEVKGHPLRVVELTGEPGDAVFCNLGILHAVSPNCLDVPRFVRVKFLM